MGKKTNNVLIGIDGSVQALNAASYASRIFPPDRTRITLFFVDEGSHNYYADTGDKPDVSEKEKAKYKQWLESREKIINAYFEQITGFFTGNGFSSGHVNFIRRELSKGVTRDIIEESKKDYDLLVVGKTGMCSATGIPMGSVTEKLFSYIFHIPLVVVAGRPETDKLLLGFDGSKGAVSAVTGLVPFLGPGKKVMLCNIIRSMGTMNPAQDDYLTSFNGWTYLPEVESERITTQKNRIEKSMEKQKQWMIDSGINEHDVATCVHAGHMSRSQSLVEKARKEGYGTLVLGRRGNSAVVEFIMGRVGRKSLQISDTMAVWIMN